MKKSLIFSLFALAAFMAPSAASAEAPLQAKSIFPFFSSEKTEKGSDIPGPAAQKTPPTASIEVTEATLDLEALKAQPLPVRRKMVAGELDAIYDRLSVLADKTKAAALLLSKNDIDTSASQTELAMATLLLAQARLTIDSLIAAANDPAHETAATLMIGTATFKDTVIKAEEELRDTRGSIISALALLKTALNAPAAAPAN